MRNIRTRQGERLRYGLNRGGFWLGTVGYCYVDLQPANKPHKKSSTAQTQALTTSSAPHSTAPTTKSTTSPIPTIPNNSSPSAVTSANVATT